MWRHIPDSMKIASPLGQGGTSGGFLNAEHAHPATARPLSLRATPPQGIFRGTTRDTPSLREARVTAMTGQLFRRTEPGNKQRSRIAVNSDARQNFPPSGPENDRCRVQRNSSKAWKVKSVRALCGRLFALEEGLVDENRLAAFELLEQILCLLIQEKLL